MSYVLLSKEAFINNIRYFTKETSQQSLIIGLKDNAYGHGIEYIETLAIDSGLKHCFIRGLADLNKLSLSSWETVLMLGSIKTNRDETAHNLHYTVNCISDLPYFLKGDFVEIKVNTGMNRNGVEIKDVIPVIDFLLLHGVTVKGVFTHFSSADISEKYTLIQSEVFNSLFAELNEKYPDLKLRSHSANTAAAEYINSNEMYRVGIGCYGYSSSRNVSRHLKPVLSLYAERMSKRILEVGESVGYDYRFFKNEDVAKVLSTFDIGYADILVRNNECIPILLHNGMSIVGKVSMDSFSAFIDVDELCVFQNVEHLASRANTTAYDILVNLSRDIKRVVK